jgi:hypothetical protein
MSEYENGTMVQVIKQCTMSRFHDALLLDLILFILNIILLIQ